MLYDPKWNETKAEPSLAGLIAWLERQFPGHRYDYADCEGACLIDQYLTAATGKASIPDPETHWPVCGGPEQYTVIAGTRPWTFGAALERARAAQSKGE